MDLWVELFISYHNYTNIFQDVNVTERKAVTDLTVHSPGLLSALEKAANLRII